MGNVKDPSWDAFHTWLNVKMKTEKIGNRQVAEHISSRVGEGWPQVSESTVSKWRHGTYHPQLRLLPYLAAAIGADATEIAIMLKALPSDYVEANPVDLSVHARKLEADLTDAHLELASTNARTIGELRQAGLQDLTDRVLGLRDWSLLLQPTFAGGPGEELHLSNRLTFTKKSLPRTTHAKVIEVFGSELRRLNASHAEPPPASTHTTTGVWTEQTSGTAFTRPSTWEHLAPMDLSASFSIPVYTIQSLPARTSRHPGFSSVLVLATTIRSWVPVFSRRLAELLGFGLTSSLDLAAVVHSRPTDDVESEHRADAAFHLIRNPPALHVAYHHESVSIRSTRTLEALRGATLDNTLVIWLSESDRLLKLAELNRAGGGSLPGDFERMVKHREDVSDFMTGLRGKNLTRRLEIPERLVRQTRSPLGNIRDDRVRYTLEEAKATYDTLTGAGWV